MKVKLPVKENQGRVILRGQKIQGATFKQTYSTACKQSACAELINDSNIEKQIPFNEPLQTRKINLGKYYLFSAEIILGEKQETYIE